MKKTRLIGLSFGAAVAASIVVLLLGMGVFGFRLSEWDEGQGRIVGVLGTVAAVAAAAFGVRIESRPETGERAKPETGDRKPGTGSSEAHGEGICSLAALIILNSVEPRVSLILDLH